MHAFSMITLTMMLVAGILCQIIAWRTRVPAILFLLLTGFIAGPVTGFVNPDALFGDLLFPIVSLGVAVILFEGSLTLRFEDISKTAGVVWSLVSIGMAITMVIATAAAHYIAGVDFDIALLFGAIVTVTGPTVIMPLLRSVRPTTAVSNILRWESIVIDPIGAILAVLVFEYITMDDMGDLWLTLGKLTLSGGVLGAFFATILAFILRRHMLPDYLTKISILAYVIGVYTLCDLIQPESGLLAVTIMGVALANKDGIYLEEILDFKESLSILIISGLFIILASRMDIALLTQTGWTSLIVLLVVAFVARPLSVFFSTLGSTLSWKERAIIGWIAPRGIIAAAIAPLFALKLDTLGIPGGDTVTSLVFIIIVGTVVIQSITAGPFSRILGVAEPEPNGVLIVGAHTLARKIGQALKDNGFTVVLADTNWSDVSEARMEGLKTFFGNVVSEHADRHLDLMGVGKLLAIAKHPSVNALASMRYRREFGSSNIFVIKTEEEEHTREKDHIAEDYTAPHLFGGNVTQSQLSGMLSNGYEIRATPITDEFSYEEFLAQNKDNALPLFAISKKEQLLPFIDNIKFAPEAGWTILSLLPADIKKDA